MKKEAYAIELKNISKYFGQMAANDKVCLQLKKGEIRSLLGENGSGKTTLMNMLSGIYYPDEGGIYIDGKRACIKSPQDAMKHKIGMIHQHFKLVELFTAAENIILGDRSRNIVNMKAAMDKINQLIDKYGFDIDLYKKTYDMSVSEKQTVEIVKTLYRGADILILDEPTAVLTPQEIKKLFSVLRRMREDKKTIIIITHKLSEVLEISDQVSILRKGKYIGTINTSQADEQLLTEMMVGRQVTLNIDRPKPEHVQKKLEIRNLSCRDRYGTRVVKNVSFDIRSGEILGIAGISGSGQKELLEAIYGLWKAEEGQVLYYPLDGSEAVELTGKSVEQLHRENIRMGFVPEDRLGMGLVGSMGMVGNMMLRSYRKGHPLIVDRAAPENLAKQIYTELEVAAPTVNTPVRRLSGGNVQKVLVGREIAGNPPVLLTAYAVRGLDINTSYSIYHLLTEQKTKGSAVVYAGEDLDVLLALCDRILVLCGGEVTGILDAETASKDEIGLLMTKKQKEGEI